MSAPHSTLSKVLKDTTAFALDSHRDSDSQQPTWCLGCITICWGLPKSFSPLLACYSALQGDISSLSPGFYEENLAMFACFAPAAWYWHPT